MSYRIFSRVLENTSSAGDGAIVFNGTRPGYRTFASVLSNGDTFPYMILDPITGAWEEGTGTFNAGGNSMTRSVEASSAGGTTPIVLAGNAATQVFLEASSRLLGPLSLRQTVATVSSSAHVLALDASDYRVFATILTESVTAFSLAAETIGLGQFLSVTLAITQGGAGGYTMTWPDDGSIRWQGGFAPSLSTIVGATDVFQFVTFDGGTTWLAALLMQAAP